MAEQTFAKPIRILHSLFALAVIAQLSVGHLMTVPEVEDPAEQHTSMQLVTPVFAHESDEALILNADGSVEESLGFEVHEFLGLFIAGLMVIRILLAMTSLPGANWRELFPWMSADGRKQLAHELSTQMSGWVKLKLAPPEGGEAVARSVHGFILIATAIMAISGTRLYFGWSTSAPQTDAVEAIAEIHETVVVILQALLAMHIGAVVLHQMQGHNILAKIKP